jgi:hypothetical protein
MANETKRFYHGTVTTLEANGGSCATGAIIAANDASLDLTAYTAPANYPHVRFALSVTLGATPTVNTIIELIARELNFDGTNDAPTPDATYRHKGVGAFTVINSASIQYYVCDVYDCPPIADYYLFNSTGTTAATGWTLKATPFTFGPV